MVIKRRKNMSMQQEFILVCYFLNCASTLAEQVFPKLFLEDEKYFRNITLPTTKTLAFYQPNVFIIGFEYRVRCEAPFPIQWDIKGYISSPECETLRPIKNGDMYLIKAFCRNRVFSLQISCMMIGNASVNTVMYVFNKNVFDLAIQLFGQDDLNVTNSKIIPCPTGDPSQDVLLFLRTKQGEEKLINGFDASLRYDPTEGFQSENIFNGEYVCRQGSSSVNVTAFSTMSADGYIFIPSVDSVIAFDGDTTQLECMSNSPEPFEIIISYDDLEDRNATRNYTVTEIGKAYVTVSYDKRGDKAVAKISGHVEDWTGFFGKALCVTDLTSPDDLTTLKSWDYKFVKSPELHLDNYWKTMQCRIYGERVDLQTVPCTDGMDCAFKLSHCQRGLATCQVKSHDCGGDIAGWTTLCKMDDEKCIEVPYTHLHGLATCSSDGIMKQWIFFESLDQRKYINWKDAPQRSLIRMDEVPHILHTNRSAQFVCEAVEFLFAELQFHIQFENESISRLVNDDGSVNLTEADSKSPRRIAYLNMIQILDIYLPLEAVAIHCVAFMWNSTEKLTASRRFRTKHLLKPQLRDNKDNVTIDESFITNRKHQRLSCDATAEPHPVYTWYFNNSKVSNVFPDLKTISGPNSESFLDFPDISITYRNIYAGNYKCVAQNELGSVEKLYNLNISDPPTPGFGTVSIASATVGVILLVILFAALLVFMRKYKNSMKELRNLTDTEVKDFFEGRPELVRSGSNAETVDFLPYNNDLEIPFSDLKFTFNDQNMLGSGEFAFVVRGLVVPKGKPVALKISKPSTDVTVFKSVLSEVKIMSYIGGHHHVVALIGVCTEFIQSRSIYIATEICGLGSLINLLITSRNSFVNYINENQQIDASIQTEATTRQLTTLDLVSFSAQIAAGMEFLAHKLVIHADLAARNVLITDNKTCKISDFGLSKKLYDSTNYVKKSKVQLPWRWMALESLKTLTFSVKSDVWSYGVTLYEIFTLGDAPFPNENWSWDFVTRLEGGLRMGRPKYSTQEIYSEIAVCWENEPHNWPDFGTCREFFDNLYKKYSPLSSDKNIQVSEADMSKNHIHSTEEPEESSCMYTDIHEISK